jgi:hypothetical protein
MYKPRWRAFLNTVLEKHLPDLNVNTVVICEYNFSNCTGTPSMRKAKEIRVYDVPKIGQMRGKVWTTIHMQLLLWLNQVTQSI